MRTLLLSSLLLGTTLHAQTLTDNYIELTVSDTLPMKVKNIIYEITPADEPPAETTYDENTDYDRLQKEAAERGQQLRAKLEKDLKSQGYAITDAPVEGDPYTVNSYDGNVEAGAGSVRVSVKDEVELRKLVAWVRQRGKTDAHIAAWNYDDKADPGSQLIASLFTQAQGRAQQLATLGGRKLGKLLLVRDPQQKELTFQDFIRMMDDRDAGNSEMERMMRARMRSMTFRFALTD